MTPAIESLRFSRNAREYQRKPTCQATE